MLVFVMVLGYIRGNIEQYSLKFFVADVFCLVSLLSGFLLAGTRRRDEMARFVSRIAVIAAVIIFATYLAIFAGVISPEDAPEGRVFTLSIFNAVGMLVVLFPWASLSTFRTKTRTSWRTPPGWRTGFLFAAVLATGVLSATRSIILLSVLVGCLYGFLTARRARWLLYLRLSVGLVVLFGLLLSGLPLFEGFVFERLRNTDVQEEARYDELTLWWSQVSEDILIGQGMGSRFVSNVIADGSPLASAPHIGIVTFLMKGGVLMFSAYALLPLILALRAMLSVRLPNEQRGAAASVIAFIGLASLSGGWSPLVLFGYGMALSGMLDEAGQMQGDPTKSTPEEFLSLIRLPLGASSEISAKRA
jgi:hypothetical protein